MDESMDLPLGQQQETISVDSIAREQLSEAARWARFLAIMGFIGCGIIVIAGILMTLFASFMSQVSTGYSYSGRPVQTFGRSALIGILYVIGSAVFYVRCLYLYRFANKMRTALRERDQQELNESFRNLKKMFRFNGILTIVIVALYVIILFAAMITAMNR